MQQIKGGWVITEEQQDDSQPNAYDVHIITPSPAQRRTPNKPSGDDRSEHGDGRICQEDERQKHPPILVRHELTNSHIEGQLNCFAETVNSASDDQAVEIVCRCTDDDPDQGYNIAADEEPSSSKEIGNSTDNGECERHGQSSRNIHPARVFRRT